MSEQLDFPDPPKLIDLVEREFLPKFHKLTGWQYRGAVKKLAQALGYQPTPRDLREPVIDWLETRLASLGHSQRSVRGVSERIRAIGAWYAIRRWEGGGP